MKVLQELWNVCFLVIKLQLKANVVPLIFHRGRINPKVPGTASSPWAAKMELSQ